MPSRRFTNLTRSVWRFPRVGKSRGKSGRLHKRYGETVVLGDVADADIQPQSRTVHCPSNVVTLTEEEYAALGPVNQRVLQALVKNGDVREDILAA